MPVVLFFVLFGFHQIDFRVLDSQSKRLQIHTAVQRPGMQLPGLIHADSAKGSGSQTDHRSVLTCKK